MKATIRHLDLNINMSGCVLYVNATMLSEKIYWLTCIATNSLGAYLEEEHALGQLPYSQDFVAAVLANFSTHTQQVAKIIN